MKKKLKFIILLNIIFTILNIFDIFTTLIGIELSLKDLNILTINIISFIWIKIFFNYLVYFSTYMLYLSNNKNFLFSKNILTLLIIFYLLGLMNNVFIIIWCL